MRLRSIEIVEDRTAHGRCDEGFITVSRLVLRNVYEDGSTSEPYPCDIASRPGSDAVVAILYELGANGDVRVILREGPRAPIYLRKHKRFERPDPREYRSIVEVVAGLLEPGDGSDEDGLRRRASIEAREEAGVDRAPEGFTPIGGESFASPGTSDEKVFFCAGQVQGDTDAPRGDGSVMEEASQLVRYELGRAIELCRAGQIPDLKTEVALLRLADHLGYIPQLGCFRHELPPSLQQRYRRLGVAAAAVVAEKR